MAIFFIITYQCLCLTIDFFVFVIFLDLIIGFIIEFVCMLITIKQQLVLSRENKIRKKSIFMFKWLVCLLSFKFSKTEF